MILTSKIDKKRILRYYLKVLKEGFIKRKTDLCVNEHEVPE